MIRIRAIRDIFKPFKKNEVVCEIDEDVVSCESEAFKQDAINYYTGVPAPTNLQDDIWFGPDPKQNREDKDYMESETELKMCAETADYVEPANIHQVMYEIAIQNQSTTLHIDPPGGSENFQGGSENVHR